MVALWSATLHTAASIGLVEISCGELLFFGRSAKPQAGQAFSSLSLAPRHTLGRCNQTVVTLRELSRLHGIQNIQFNGRG